MGRGGGANWTSYSDSWPAWIFSLADHERVVWQTDGQTDELLWCSVNRQGLDITLLAEPSSDEDDKERSPKQKKRNSQVRRRKQAAVSDKDNKDDVKSVPTSAVSVATVCVDEPTAADITCQTTSANNKPVTANKARRKLKR